MTVRHVTIADAAPQPEAGGSHRVFYRSGDGSRLAGIFRESGPATVAFEYDEFLCVLAGQADYRVDGAAGHWTARPGDALYIEAGTTVEFQLSPDYMDVACMIGDRPIDL
jgi:uncharacterized cupin superfamily protein